MTENYNDTDGNVTNEQYGIFYKNYSNSNILYICSIEDILSWCRIYFDNGICKCEGVSNGDTATISGTTYTVVNNTSIRTQIASGNVNLCTTLVTNMSQLFKNNSNFNSNIGFWDTSNVRSMYEMFLNADSFNQPIGNWDTSNVTTTRGMFYSMPFNQPIGNWNTSKVQDMLGMFELNTAFNQPIGGWNVASVTTMKWMFKDASSFNQPIGNWNSWIKYIVLRYQYGNWDVFRSQICNGTCFHLTKYWLETGNNSNVTHLMGSNGIL